jgi:hypothetical protein
MDLDSSSANQSDQVPITQSEKYSKKEYSEVTTEKWSNGQNFFILLQIKN